MNMSDAINNRKDNQEYIRQVQQTKSERRKELAQSAQEDLRSLKQHYKDENARLDEESSAVINHIKTDTEATDQEARAEQIEKKQQAQTYNRSGKTESRPQAQQAARQSTKPTSREKPAAMTQNYVTRDTDAFYKVQDRGSQISESSDGYEIQAYVPEHEKDNLRVTIQNDKAIISGKRKFKDAVETEDKKISTNNFQTFHEEFKLGRPVSTAGMTREREGDYIKFFIPKLESIKFDEES